jgi:hypothetical protein
VEVGRIEVDVGELDVVQGAGAERADGLIESGAILETSDLETPVPPIASTRSSTLRVEIPWT